MKKWCFWRFRERKNNILYWKRCIF